MVNPIVVGQLAGREQNKPTRDIFQRELSVASAFTLNCFVSQAARRRRGESININCVTNIHVVSIFIGIMYGEDSVSQEEEIVNPQLKLYYEISVISALLGFRSLLVLHTRTLGI